MTKRGGIIGNPIAHSLSPAMYTAAFPAMGIDATYEAWRAEDSEVAGYVERLHNEEMLCMNVTVPHKEAVAGLLAASKTDGLDEMASKIGAVNCISKGPDGRLTGHNTDQYGFMRALKEAGASPAGMKTLVLGYKGSARAVTYALQSESVASITIAGRNAQGVAGLAADVRSWSPGLDVRETAWDRDALTAAASGANLIVNCTPVGMTGGPEPDGSPVPKEALRPGLWVYDLVFNPQDTTL